MTKLRETYNSDRPTANAILIQLSRQLLERAFNLPDDARITGIQYNAATQVLTIRIDHPQLPKVPETSTP